MTEEDTEKAFGEKVGTAQALRFAKLMYDLDRAGTPFPKLQVPPFSYYREGPWELAPGEYKGIVRGYFSGLQPMRENWILRNHDEKKIWMSITPMELESQSHHAVAARGRVLIGGGGMGVIAWNCAIKPEVSEVVIVERDPQIVLLCNHIAYSQKWPYWREKVRWYTGDVLEYRPAPGERFDVAIIDIWQGLGDMRIRPDMQTVHRNVQAEEYAAWGMELDYISWCQQSGYESRDADRPHLWRQYAQAVGVPWIMQNEPRMGAFALQAALQYVKTCDMD